MGKGKKVRLITIIVVVALLLTTQYRTIYDVVMSSSFVQAMMEYSVSDNSVEENASEQDTMDGMELESKDEILNQGVEGEDLTDYGIQIQIEDKEESYKEDVSNAFWNDGFTEETVSDNELPVIEVSMNDIEELEQAGADLGTSAIPTEVDAFIAWYSQKPADDKKVHISTYQDWMNVQTISQKMDLKGYEFQIDDNKSPSATDAKLHKLNDFSGFVGIGTEEFPFRGSLTGYLATGLSIETRVPIFAYLSTESNLSNLHIRVNSGTAGLAAHVIEYPNSGSEGVTGIISLSNIRIGGTISNSKGAAGGLFGEIRNNCATPLKISVTKFNNIGVTFDVYSIVGSDGKPTTQKLTIYGVYSGAIAGIVSGNVEYEFDAVKYDLSNVYYVQGATPVATLTNSCVDLTDMTISGANGTLFGLVRDIPATVYTPVIRIMSSDNQSDTIHIQLPFGPEPSTSGLWGYGSNGGLIGHLKKGTLDASTHEICIIGMGKKDNSDVRGALNSAYGTSGIGGMIGVLEDSIVTSGSKFEVNKVFVQGMKITETYRYVKGLGGFFGLVINSSIPASVNGEDVFTITDCYVNTDSKTPCFGAAGLAGVYIDTQGINNTFSGIKFTHLAVHTQEDGNTVRPSVGSVVGLCKMGNEKSLTISDWDLKGIFVTSNKGNGAGGVIGCTMAETAADTANVKVLNGSLDTKPVSGVSNTYMVKNDTFLIWDDYKQTGGIIGVVENANCQIDNIHVIGMALRSYSHSGGVIGQIRETTNKKYISISNMVLDLVSQSCNQNYETNSVGIKGLLLGKVEGNTIVRFDGNMDFSNTKWYWADLQNDPNNYHIGKNYLGAKTGNVGIIAGTQERAVIYMDKTCTYKPYKYNASDSYQTRRLRYVDEIGNFGGAFRNITDGNSYVFEEDEVVGTITKSGDTYQLQSEADVVRLAVALNSEGAFGTKCFDAGSSDCSDAGTACYQALMESDYVLTADTYDLTDTGIVCMQRSKGLGSSAVSSSALTADVAIFSGSFSGADAGAPAEIIHNIASNRHENQGLFTHVGTASGSNEIAKFENLKLTESIIATEMEAGNATAIVQKMSKGGLSVYASGNVLVNNCELDIDMTSQTYADATAKNYYAGLFGKYVSYAGSNLTINNVISKGAKIVRDNDHYVSQLIACVESPVTPTTLPTIEMNDITISGSVENTVAKDTCYLGGVIAAMNENKEDGSIHTSWKNDTENWQSYETERSVLTVDGLTISDFTLTNSSSAYRSSGFLGFWWLDVDATLQNVIIGEAGKPNTLQTNKRFGGLINEVTGKMVLDNISVKNTLMNNTNTKKHSAVLVAVAEKVFLTVRDYVTDETTVVNRTDTVEFDEIAGHNKQSSVYGYNDYSFSEGGGSVLSIESSTQDKSLVFDENYNSYKSRITYQKNGATIEPKDVKNDGTRYYYDINTILQNGGNLTDAIISTPDEIMRWHLLHYVKAEFRKYFATQEEMVDIDDVRRQDFTISGTIDLNGYSYYPTPLTNKVVTGDNAKIIFYGQNVIDKETDDVARYRQPYDYDKQHYMLHTGLLYKVTACNISKLTLSGTVSERKNGASGALICSDILGVAATSDEDLKAGLKYSTKSEDYTNISDIVLDNLWVATKEKKMSGAPYSLMIDKIDDGAKVNFSKIRMTNYENESPTGYKYAGRALIGVVGTESSTADEKDIEMKLNFTDIDIADLKDDVDLSNPSGLPLDLQNATNGDKVLKTASLIYCYNYYADTSSAIYFYKSRLLKRQRAYL